MKSKDLAGVIGHCQEAAEVLKLLAHPQRLQLLCHICGEERTVCELARLCGASQSQVSQFLARMKSEGLVSGRREGNFVAYRVADEKVLRLIKSLRDVFCPGRK
jgi:DNA-binding transcriptional ArsR family regulator